MARMVKCSCVEDNHHIHFFGGPRDGEVLDVTTPEQSLEWPTSDDSYTIESSEGHETRRKYFCHHAIFIGKVTHTWASSQEVRDEWLRQREAIVTTLKTVTAGRGPMTNKGQRIRGIGNPGRRSR